jgi:hypothetical protein
VPLLHAIWSLHRRARCIWGSRRSSRRPDEGFRHAQELLRGGEVERALHQFVAHSRA